MYTSTELYEHFDFFKEKKQGVLWGVGPVLIGTFGKCTNNIKLHMKLTKLDHGTKIK